jgi:hypothetical protein
MIMGNGMEGSQERFLAFKDDRSLESTLKTRKFTVHKGRGDQILIHTCEVVDSIVFVLHRTHTKKFFLGPGKRFCRAERHIRASTPKSVFLLIGVASLILR